MNDAPVRESRPFGLPITGWWAQAAVVAMVVAAFTIVFIWAAKRDVVASWKVLATCTAPATAVVAKSMPVVDISPCSSDQVEVGSARGWPILTFALPSSAGLTPHITSLTSNKDTRTVELHFDSDQSAGSPDGDYVLVYVEIPPNSLPQPPFTIRDEVGPTTVETIRIP